MKKAVISVVNPEDVVVELSCCLPVKTWRKVRGALRERDVGHYEYDVAEFYSAVDDAVRLVERDFCGFSQVTESND